MLLYFHRNHQIGLGADVELGYRSRKGNGLNYEFFTGIGYLRSILPRPVYDFDQADPPPLIKGKGSSHLLKLLGFGIGSQLGNDLNDSFWTIKPTLLQLRPFNTRFTYNFALDAGIQFFP